MKVRVAFVIGQYPPEERKRREEVALSYATPEIEIGIISTSASPYIHGMSPADIQMAAPYFIEAFREAERQGYDAAVPLGMLDLGIDGGKSAVDIPVVGPFEATFHVASLLGDRFGLIVYHPRTIPFTRAMARRYQMEAKNRRHSQRRFFFARYCGEPRSDGAELRRPRPRAHRRRRRRGYYSHGHHPMPGPHKTGLAARTARRSGGGRLRRADSHGGAPCGSRSKAKQDALAQIEFLTGPISSLENTKRGESLGSV